MNEKLCNFEVILSGVCISSFKVTVDCMFIVECEFTGGCKNNLKVLRDNLIGEQIFDAKQVILNDCCANEKSHCVRKLVPLLIKKFQEIAEKYEKGV